MAEQANEEKPVTDSPEQGTPPAKVKEPADKESEKAPETDEASELEKKKEALEAEVQGLEGTVGSLKEDIVRKRQERRSDEQPIDEEALIARLQPALEEKLQEQIKPVLEENEKLRKGMLESSEKELKAKKTALDSLNARIASATASRSASVDTEHPEEVILSDAEKDVVQAVGLKDPRRMKDSEV